MSDEKLKNETQLDGDGWHEKNEITYNFVRMCVT